MSKWKCEICGTEFNNFHAQGFDGKIYCPLCYFKKENQELKKQIEEKENQQKEFIEWLEKESEELIRDAGYHQRICLDILEKYKEIIGCKEVE